MARPAAKKAAARQPEPEELPFGKYVDKEPTAVHEACAEWIEANTGYEVDLKSVQLTALLYGRFQKSPENQERIAAARENAATAAEEREENATKRAAKKSASKPPTRRRGAASDEAEPEPARGRGRGATAVSGARPARGRRRPAPEESEDLD
jgi:hypothetical protein